MPREAMELWERRLRQFLQANGFDNSNSIPQAIEQMPVATRRAFQRYGDSCYHKLLDKGLGACVLLKPSCRQSLLGHFYSTTALTTT